MALLDATMQADLLRRARRAIARAIGAPAPPAFDAGPEAPIPDTLRAGAFVTIRIRGRLRGCIGYPEPELPLVEAVERCAVSAAISDPRFPPLTETEWQDADLELSVLGPIERIQDLQSVVVGRHGLIVESGHRRGLLLPQVASERDWSAAEFAAQTCVKAGLPRDSWQKGALLFRFEAEVFGECSADSAAYSDSSHRADR